MNDSHDVIDPSPDSSSASSQTPWHLWAVGALSLLWNGMGAANFVMTNAGSEAVTSQLTEPQLAFFNAMPMWLIIVWAVAVFGAVLGSLLLLLRTQFAVPVLGVSFVAMVITTIRNYLFANAIEVTGTEGLVFSLIIFVIAGLLFFYAVKMKQKSVLR